MNIKRIMMAGAWVVMAAGALAANSVISNVTAQQRYPWNGKVDISYTVTGDIAAAASERRMPPPALVVTARDRIPEPEHSKVQLWAGGPYWATTNIGANEPWDYGYYFWWGDTLGYKRENDAWVASDGSMSGLSFCSENPLTCKDTATLCGEGLITAENTLAPKHDAARVLWGEGWRMPTDQEMGGLVARCDWSWATTNGVNGYIVRGRGDYASASIFLPCSGYGDGPSLNSAGSFGYYWSSVPLSDSDYYRAWNLCFNSSYHTTHYGSRENVQSVRPVQGFTE